MAILKKVSSFRYVHYNKKLQQKNDEHKEEETCRRDDQQYFTPPPVGLSLDEEDLSKKIRLVGGGGHHLMAFGEEEEEEQSEKVACVTSAASYLGIALVNHLLAQGYSVSALVDKQEDVERLKMEVATSAEGRMNTTPSIKWVINLTHQNDGLETLYEAFNGCHVVFHLSSCIDPSGLSGYTKSMVEVEVQTTKKVLEACANTPTITKCVMTSSLLACIWQQTNKPTPIVIDHDSWSQESICKQKKLWYALGKLKAEKQAWRIATETNGFTLATICPGLITGPDYARENPTPSVAYLKGHQEMYRNGLFATVDITYLAQAHLYVCQGMNKNKTTGYHQRYLCYDRVVRSQVELGQIQREMGISPVSSIQSGSTENLYHLSNANLYMLISSTNNRRRCYNKEGPV